MRTAFLACLATVLLTGVASADSIKGDYLEARNANVWAAPCVVNSEIGMIGDTATMAWKINEGSFENVKLDGLVVAAVVFGSGTFGVGKEVKTRTVFIVDDRADKNQKAALLKMAVSLAGKTVQNVVAVKTAKIKMEVGHGDEIGFASLDAGIAKVRTRRMKASDNLCGLKERMAYPSLSKVQAIHPAFTITNDFSGKEFKVKYTDKDYRSGVIGNFSL